MKTDDYKRAKTVIPEPTLHRFPIYLQMLKRNYDIEGINVSSSEIARRLDLKSIQVRKDLEYTSAVGKPKTGYNAKELIISLEKFLGVDSYSDAFLVGCGNLGRALLGFSGFDDIGIKIRAVFDVNPNLIGTQVSGYSVFNLSRLSNIAQHLKVKIAILAVPPEKAQETAELLCEAGIRAIWNFAPVHLKVPDNVIVQNENMAASLLVLVKKMDDSIKGYRGSVDG